MASYRKTIYLIRHGEIASDGKRCIGVTEVPLTPFGQKQARRLGMWMTRKQLYDPSRYRVFASPLQRCQDTARAMIDLPQVKPERIETREELHEVMMGEWENMRFSDIKMRYPVTYEKRGRNFWDFKAPGGESFREAGKRFVSCLKEIALEENKDDADETCFVVAHVGVIRSALVHLGAIDAEDIMKIMIPYAGVCEINTDVIDGEVSFEVRFIGATPIAVPGEDEITDLLDRYQVPAHIRRHMKGVANVLLDIADILDPDHSIYDREILYASAMLHDFARLEKNHSALGALKLRIEGYDLVADIISEHDSLVLHKDLAFKKGDRYYISNEDLLYYADKRVLEDTVVSLSERFNTSLRKCKTPEARINHKKRLDKAVIIEKDIFRDCEQMPDIGG